MADFQPDIDDTSISIPITFDYKGGRSQSKKGKIMMTAIIVVLFILGEIIIFAGLKESLELWQRLGIASIYAYVLLFIIRFFVFHELRYSDMYEELKRIDYQPETSVFWKIFDIDHRYPYICFFQNGYKGIFVKMEKGPISGKPDTAVYDHYEKISDSYNVAHSLNMDIVHIDYMDSVGNDYRISNLMENLVTYTNPEMVSMLIDIFTNLQEEASHNYSNYDIYLFLTKDKADNFLYNIRQVVNGMVGGNFITYSFLDRNKIREVCLALWNLSDLSINACCETVLTETSHTGVVPIAVYHADGTVEELGKTVAEKKRIAEENARKAEDRRREQEIAKQKAKEARKAKKRGIIKDTEDKIVSDENNEDIDLF